MGADGGTIPTRGEMVTLKRPDHKSGKAGTVANPRLHALQQWQTCALTAMPLRWRRQVQRNNIWEKEKGTGGVEEDVVVACELGRLYNRDAVIEFLLKRRVVEKEIERKKKSEKKKKKKKKKKKGDSESDDADSESEEEEEEKEEEEGEEDGDEKKGGFDDQKEREKERKEEQKNERYFQMAAEIDSSFARLLRKFPHLKSLEDVHGLRLTSRRDNIGNNKGGGGSGGVVVGTEGGGNTSSSSQRVQLSSHVIGEGDYICPLSGSEINGFFNNGNSSSGGGVQEQGMKDSSSGGGGGEGMTDVVFCYLIPCGCVFSLRALQMMEKMMMKKKNKKTMGAGSDGGDGEVGGYRYSCPSCGVMYNHGDYYKNQRNKKKRGEEEEEEEQVVVLCPREGGKEEVRMKRRVLRRMKARGARERARRREKKKKKKKDKKSKRKGSVEEEEERKKKKKI
eukprot:Nk52_evm62s223 gene=Nk52_evmTU62s223